MTYTFVLVKEFSDFYAFSSITDKWPVFFLTNLFPCNIFIGNLYYI